MQNLVLLGAKLRNNFSTGEMWAYKTIIMDRIIESKGGNDYDRRRTTEERESRKRARGQ